MAYKPAELPVELQQLIIQLRYELDEIAKYLVLSEIDHVKLPELHVEPNKLLDGMIVLADGTDWDPGSGGGYYGYRNGGWTFLG